MVGDEIWGIEELKDAMNQAQSQRLVSYRARITASIEEDALCISLSWTSMHDASIYED